MCVAPGTDVEGITGAAMAYGNDYWELVTSSVSPAGHMLLCCKRPRP